MSHKQILVVFGSLMLGLLLASLDNTIVSTAIRTIIGDIGGQNGLARMPWVTTAYVLASTAATPIYGKLSDLFGRKPLYMIAIALFLTGSALSGLSQNLDQLIAFRALQGLGAGGIMGLTFAIVGDVVPPRERGKYQGLFGGVFMLAMVAGPLLGGIFTEHNAILGITGWRWVFYVNLPIGIIALFVISAVLHLPKRRMKATIDYIGATLVVAGVVGLLLAAQMGGQQYAWGSPVIIGLAIAGVVLLVAFVLWEIRTPEPILPMRLFRGAVFRVSNIMGFLIGMVMMGAMMYIPFYFQVVNFDSPTKAGLRMLPMMVGLLATSISSGRIISKTGRYRFFPIAGIATTTVGLGLMTTMDENTNFVLAGLFMFIVGLGLGATMQVLVLAVQNAVEMKDMGVATTSTTFFRSLGQTFGAAIMGAILTNQLTSHLKSNAGPSAALAPVRDHGMEILQSQDAMGKLPAAVQHVLIHSFTQALSTVFLVGAGLSLIAWIASWFLKEHKLRSMAPADVAKQAGSSDVEAPAMAH
ncbi:DHA2 family efflux MFS transporter permease subunit [Catenulispora sp. NF23]|uniref:DHA2 family efflux MFS transporter permease subunit n=2 Tax=Catenulispora pinistramenti TaxID=2705254 RepID=A0ABS5KY26_9ACTN|nr:DHA2 family efflux MFS transporter permease subunit [Catenulispora pinistramenti]MBS2550971.1 DHA2 family efflux MFS transporter permease subunit [Catenulispora pinistramenti]